MNQTRSEEEEKKRGRETGKTEARRHDGKNCITLAQKRKACHRLIKIHCKGKMFSYQKITENHSICI